MAKKIESLSKLKNFKGYVFAEADITNSRKFTTVNYFNLRDFVLNLKNNPASFHEVLRKCKFFLDLEGHLTKEEFDKNVGYILSNFSSFFESEFPEFKELRFDIKKLVNSKPIEGKQSCHLIFNITYSHETNETKENILKSLQKCQDNELIYFRQIGTENPKAQLNFWKKYEKFLKNKYIDFEKIIDFAPYKINAQFRTPRSFKPEVGPASVLISEKCGYENTNKRFYKLTFSGKQTHISKDIILKEIIDFSSFEIELSRNEDYFCSLFDKIDESKHYFMLKLFSLKESEFVPKKYDLWRLESILKLFLSSDTKLNFSKREIWSKFIWYIKAFTQGIYLQKAENNFKLANNQFFDHKVYVPEYRLLSLEDEYFNQYQKEYVDIINDFMSKVKCPDGQVWNQPHHFYENRELFIKIQVRANPAFETFIEFLKMNRINYTKTTYSKYFDVNDLDLSKRLIAIKSHCGSGKSYSLLNHLKDKKILYLSYRVALATEISKKYGFVNYQDQCDFDDDIPQKYAIQLESLYKVSYILKHYEYVLFDESEQFVDQINNIKNGNLNEINKILKYILNEKSCIFMSANLSYKTINFIEQFTDSEIFTIKNKYKPNTGHNVFYFEKKEELVKQVFQLAKEGKKLCISCNTRKECKKLQVRLSKIENIKILMMTSKTEGNRQIIENINEQWSKYDIVIYSACVEAGNSFEKEHFDHIIGFFETYANSSQSCFQMLHRCRNPKSKDIYLYSAPGTGDQKISIELIGMRAHYRNMYNNSTLANSFLLKDDSFEEIDFGKEINMILLFNEIRRLNDQRKLREYIFRLLRKTGFSITEKVCKEQVSILPLKKVKEEIIKEELKKHEDGELKTFDNFLKKHNFDNCQENINKLMAIGKNDLNEAMFKIDKALKIKNRSELELTAQDKFSIGVTEFMKEPKSFEEIKDYFVDRSDILESLFLKAKSKSFYTLQTQKQMLSYLNCRFKEYGFTFTRQTTHQNEIYQLKYIFDDLKTLPENTENFIILR